MLKHLPGKSLDTIKENIALQQNKGYPTRRRSNTSNTPGDRTDANLGSRLTEFHALL